MSLCYWQVLVCLFAEATPKAIMRTMNVKGLTLFHLKSHLQVIFCVFKNLNYLLYVNKVDLLEFRAFEKL